VRSRTEKGQTTGEVVHGITSRSRQRGAAKRLRERIRGPWAIANGLPYRRDVTLGEEASRVRQGVAPQVMAALRNSVLHVRSGVVAPRRGHADDGQWPFPSPRRSRLASELQKKSPCRRRKSLFSNDWPGGSGDFF
jgi:hypothetical protein